MFRHLLALSVVLCAFSTGALAGLSGTFSAVSKLGKSPVYARLNVAKDGAATGVIIVNAERLILAGDTPDTIEVVDPLDSTTTVEIVADETRRRPYEITLTSGEDTVTFRLAAKPGAVPFAGYFTVYAPGNLKAPEPETPEGEEPPEEPAPAKERPQLLDGHGIGVMHVSRTGLVRTALHLADGKRMMSGAAFDSPFTVPLCALSFQVVDEGEGTVRMGDGCSFTGTLSFVSNDASDGSGLFRWIRRAGPGRSAFRFGFDIYQPLAISRYKVHDQPLKTDQGPQGRATLKGGPLTRNVQAPITFDNGKLSAPEFGLTSGLNLFSGAFSGEVRLPILGIPARAAGIVFPKHNRIYGVAHTRFGSTALTIEADNEHLKD